MDVLNLLSSISTRLGAIEQRLQGQTSATATATAGFPALLNQSVSIPEFAGTLPVSRSSVTASTPSASAAASATVETSPTVSSSEQLPMFMDYSPVQRNQRFVHNTTGGAYSNVHSYHFEMQRSFARNMTKKLKDLIATRGAELGEKKVNELKSFLDRWENTNRGSLLRAYNASGAVPGSTEYLKLYMADQRWIRNVNNYINSNGAVGWSDENGTAAYSARVNPQIPPKGERGLKDSSGKTLAVVETQE